MNRRALFGLAGASAVFWGLNRFVDIRAFGNLFDGIASEKSEKMPLLFIGHGSPMNAIESNAYTKTLSSLGHTIQKPNAVLVISAHWMTRGTWVTAMDRPKTIHDFYGFSKALFEIQYPAPGSPETAKLIQDRTAQFKLHNDHETWGLDHGTWSVLRHIYPNADVPTLQLSLDLSKPPEYHRELGRLLSKLREKGVLIVGSGNLVHNLREIRWEPNAKPFDWAVEFDDWLKDRLLARDFHSVLIDFHRSVAGQLSVPTLDHYIPLHYILGAASDREDLEFVFEEIQNGSISMRSVQIG